MKKHTRKRESRRRQPAAHHPVYPSLAAAAGALGVPQSRLKAAKVAGCPAFKAANRIDSRELLAWLLVTPAPSGPDLAAAQARLATARAEMIERELQGDASGETLPREAAERALRLTAWWLSGALPTVAAELGSSLFPTDRQRAIEATAALKVALRGWLAHCAAAGAGELVPEWAREALLAGANTGLRRDSASDEAWRIQLFATGMAASSAAAFAAEIKRLTASKK
jgi:hypothetical protein